jgi:signal transduction histidine kinase
MGHAGGRSRSLMALVAGVVGAGAALLVHWLAAIEDWSAGDAVACGGILLATAIAERFPLVLQLRGERDDYSLSDAIWAGSLLLVEPSVLAVAATGGLLLGLGLRRQSPVKLAFNLGQDMLAISAALAVFGWLGSPPADSAAGWGAAALAMAAYRTVNTVIVGVLLALIERRPLSEMLLAGTSFAQWSGNVAIGLLGALVWTAAPLGLPLLLIPLALTVHSYRGWLRTVQERDVMALMGQTADTIATSDDLSTRLASSDVDGPVSELSTTLNRMLERLELSLRRERTFIRETSHELRTPITISRGWLDVLGSSPSAAELEETTAVLRDELERMARIIEDMSDIALMEDPGSLRRTEVDLARFVQELASKAQPLVNGPLRIDVSDPLGVAMADGQRLTQALINLLRNAEQHTPAGTRIELSVARRNGSWRFEVSDSGGGLPFEAEAMAFQPFFKGEESDGSGLGLAIVAGIARAHGGSSGLANRRGDGATFWVEIPR